MNDVGGDHGMFGNMGGIQAMGIVNALKTGDVRLDMMIAMMIPFVMSFALGLLSKLSSLWDMEKLETWWKRRGRHRYQRFIVYKSQRLSWGGVTNLEPDTKNTVLLKAIQLYLHHQGNLDLPIANLNLTSMEDMTGGEYYGNSNADDGKTLVGTLSKLRIVKKPLENQWHRLGMYGTKPDSPAMVELWISDTEESVGSGKDSDNRAQCTTTFQFASSGPTAIDCFIDTAYQWYMQELRKMEDNSRYLYELKAIKSGSSSSDGATDEATQAPIVYSRYKLSDEKTFASLFFRQKDSLLNMIDHFQAKSGKYAIAGYPHKLGLLLHGPPGTGKTSLIKALAQYTGRSIVNVPLTRITTNSELMDIFFEKQYHVRGEDVPIKLGFMDVIFVLEDVDAASKVVRRRDEQYRSPDPAALLPLEVLHMPQPKSVWKMMLESNSPECRECVTRLMEKSKRLKTAAQESNVLESIARRMTTVPGLSLIGEGSEDEALEQIEAKAVEKANQVMGAMETYDRFLGAHAQTIKTLLDADIEINEAFIDELLDTTSGDEPNVTMERPLRSSVTNPRYSDAMEEAIFGMDDDDVMAAATMRDMSDRHHAPSNDAPKGSKEAASLFRKPIKDEMTLSGLLNVLDGVVDTPGRVLIMTTNHPEMLDPAIIRPGRIDKKILLGYMSALDVTSMLQHYFQTTLNEEQKSRIEALIATGFNMTPAQIEQMTAENDEVEDMIAALEHRSQFRSLRRGSSLRKVGASQNHKS